MATANRFYRELDSRRLAFKFDSDEVGDIQTAAHQVVLEILKRVKDADDRFACKDAVRVGSFMEGTKILEPDEFDYLAVVDELSKPGVVSSVKCGEELRGYMTLQIADEKTRERWLEYCEDDRLFGFVLPSPKYTRKESSTAVGFSALIVHVYKESGRENPILVSKPTGQLKFAGARAFREPNTLIYLLWSSERRNGFFNITADISPAVRCYNVTDAITQDGCSGTIFYNKIEQHGSYLLTPGKGHRSKPTRYFRISMTEVEVDIMKSLDTTHKTCYRVLKYILANHCCKFSYTDMRYSGFSSYILKSAVLHHVAREECQGTHVHVCIEKVVYSLLNCLMKESPGEAPYMPSVFIKDHNLVKDLMNYGVYKPTAIEVIMHTQSLITFLGLTHKLVKVPEESYGYEKANQMLDTYLTDLKQAHKKASKIADGLVGKDGEWGVEGLSITELMKTFGVPDKILQD